MTKSINLNEKTKAELVAMLEKSQKAVAQVESSDDATDAQKEEAAEKFALLHRAKSAVQGGYIKAKTFLGRLFHRVKSFLSTVWGWLKGMSRVVIDSVVGAFKGLADFLGKVLARFTRGLQDAVDKAVRVAIPNAEDEENAQQREALNELKRLDAIPVAEVEEAAAA